MEAVSWTCDSCYEESEGYVDSEGDFVAVSERRYPQSLRAVGCPHCGYMFGTAVPKNQEEVK